MCYDNTSTMTDIQKDVKNAGQNLEAKAETAKIMRKESQVQTL